MNRLLLLFYILLGQVSFVGAPLTPAEKSKPKYLYKPGLTGLVQLNQGKIRTNQDREIYELYYIRNQDIWLDLEILFKTFTSKSRR